MTARRPSAPIALLALASLALPAAAQFKVVHPDGSVSYTDRPPPDARSRAMPLPGGAAAQAPAPSASPLPPALATAAAKYPVTLYTSPDCEPCANARKLLRDRGIPHTERLVTTVEEGEAMKRLTGGPEVPTLTIGSDVFRGLNSAKWTAYLDAAGYPATSKLPRDYAFGPPQPMVPPRPPAPVTAAPAPAVPVAPPPSDDNPAGIKF